MAQLNFNALAPSGPVGFSQGFSQGRKEKTASEMDQLTLESGRFKMDEMKRDRAEMLELQEKLKGLGQDPDLNKFFDTISATGNPKYVEMANQGRQKLRDQLSFANILGGGVAPQAAPQPQAAPSEPYPGYNEEIGMAAPANALAARQAPAPMPAAPVNAMAPQQPGGLPTQDQINAAYRLGTPAAIDWANKAQKFLVDSRESQLDRTSREGISEAGIAGRASEGRLDRGARASEGNLNRGVQLAGQAIQEKTQSLAQQRFDRENDPQFAQRMEAAKTQGRLAATNDIEAKTVLPGVINTAENVVRLVDTMIGKRDDKGNLLKGEKPHRGFANAVGFGFPGARYIPGTPAADFQSYLNQVNGTAFLQAFETLKGGGQITEIEGLKATQAINRMDSSTTEKEFINAARDFQDVVRGAVGRAKDKVKTLDRPSSGGADIESLLNKYK